MSGFDPKKHHRRSIRLKGYDYSLPGGYFVTLCTQNGACIFGDVEDESVSLSPYGEIASRCWEEIPCHFSNVILDECVIMPNHLHGIIILRSEDVQHLNVRVQHVEPVHDGSQDEVPRENSFQHIVPHSIGSIMRSYKAAVTRICRQSGMVDFQWQRNYFEHVIRSDKDLNAIREYIRNNPAKWILDEDQFTSY